jgi:hypothetical protein
VRATVAPVVLGQTLATSGSVGAAIGGLRNGLAVWAKDINARGGLQCHPVQLIQCDDESDSARVTANWNAMIHDRGAVAMVGAGVRHRGVAHRGRARPGRWWAAMSPPRTGAQPLPVPVRRRPADLLRRRRDRGRQTGAGPA